MIGTQLDQRLSWQQTMTKASSNGRHTLFCLPSKLNDYFSCYLFTSQMIERILKLALEWEGFHGNRSRELCFDRSQQ